MKNQYKIDGNTLIVYNRKDGKEMLFDAEDFDLVKQYTWCIHRTGYAVTNAYKNKKWKMLIAHRLIMSAPKHLQVDHISGTRTDNHKQNLRLVTSQINQHNRKGKGYTWNKNANKYMAYISINYKLINLGYYNTESQARHAYLEAKKIYHPTAPV